jgi:hypothetical protein
MKTYESLTKHLSKISKDREPFEKTDARGAKLWTNGHVLLATRLDIDPETFPKQDQVEQFFTKKPYLITIPKDFYKLLKPFKPTNKAAHKIQVVFNGSIKVDDNSNEELKLTYAEPHENTCPEPIAFSLFYLYALQPAEMHIEPNKPCSITASYTYNHDQFPYCVIMPS